MQKIKEIIKLLRVKHYIKNLLVFLPLLFSQQLFSAPQKLIAVCWGFVSFCLVSSAVYIFNDIQDVEKDRKHPTKKNRPIASGAVGQREAMVYGVICAAAAVAINLALGSLWGLGLLLLYLALNVAYSLGLKNKAIIDVTILTSGFLIRLLYGSALTQIPISEWMFLTITAGVFYLGLGKRRNELIRIEKSAETRAVLKYYTYSFLDKNMYISATLAIVFYTLWVVSREIPLLIWTVPAVMLIFMRYSLDMEANSDGDPVEIILHDWVLLVMCCLYGLFVVSALYLH